jgi:DNA polymerase-4
VTRRARRAGRVGRTVVLRLRFGDFTRATRSRTLARPTASTATVLVTLRALLAAERDVIRRRGLTLLGVTLTNLERADAGVQLELDLDLDGHPTAALDTTVDAIRDRFGTTAVQRAVLLGRSDRTSAWLMPGDGADGLPERR